MDTAAISTQIALLIFFILLSAFFSSSETSMMSVNRYRMKHLANHSTRAKLVQKLLERTDRLLGLILLGNTFATLYAGSLGTLIAIHFWGEEWGVLIAGIALTLIMLLFAEVSPKTLAAVYPEKIALTFSYPLFFLLRLFYPIIWSINALANSFLRLCGVSLEKEKSGFTRDELRLIVHETTGKIHSKHQKMLLSILDLEHITVDDIMIPRNEVTGLDLDNEWNTLLKQLSSTPHTFMPVYRQDLHHVVGILHAKTALHLISSPNFNEEKLIAALEEPIFIPESTSLTKQMAAFQKDKKRFALVVDEYGDILGAITLEDILEEIVGDFTTNLYETYTAVLPQQDGAYLAEGSTPIRDFNRMTQWDLPTNGPKTLNGLVLQQLQSIPTVGTCCLIQGLPVEVIQVQENKVKMLKIFPPIKRETADDF